MQEEVKYREDHPRHFCPHTAFCFVKWGLWFFIIGVVLGFGVLIHYLLGSSYDTSQYFLSNITLWFGSPLALSAGFLQVGGLGMAFVGALYTTISKCCVSTTPNTYDTANCPKHKKASFVLCVVGLIALILTGYIGYYIIDYFWPGFYYAPIMAGKNLWLILQGLSMLIYVIGMVIATICLSKCKREICSSRP